MNTQTGCFESVSHLKASREGLGNTEKAALANLEYSIQKAREACKEGPQFNTCITGFLSDLEACEGVGDNHLKAYVSEVRRAAEPHGVPAGKPVQMSKEDRGSSK